jgi:tripartite-type tricarboxylate transporter receptor subunit TctC
VVCALLGFIGIASAQDYPDAGGQGRHRLLAGGALDILGRLIAHKLSQMWGQQSWSKTAPAASGNIGRRGRMRLNRRLHAALRRADARDQRDAVAATAFDPVTSFDPIMLVASPQEVFQVSAVTPY